MPLFGVLEDAGLGILLRMVNNLIVNWDGVFTNKRVPKRQALSKTFRGFTRQGLLLISRWMRQDVSRTLSASGIDASIRLFVAGICLSIGIASAAYAKDEIHLVADEWPPFSGNALPNGGISLDVISAVFERAGYPVRTEILPWARVISGAKSGAYDAVGSLFFDPEIAEFMSYSDPFYETTIQFLQRTGAGHEVNGLGTIGELSIAVGEGFLYEEEFDRADYLNKVHVTTALQGIKMVAYGRVDLTLDSVDVLKHAIDTEIPELKDALTLLPFVLERQHIHMALRADLPNRETVLSDFNAALRSMQIDGSLEALLEKHRL